MKIISGGQTGVDRAALDVALELGLGCGGHCPKGRLAEDGPIAAKYPLQETPTADSSKRSEWNVRDSDGTLILTSGGPTGGTALTVEFARRLRRPCLVVDLDLAVNMDAVTRWLAENGIQTLNIAGPRASECPHAYALAVAVLRKLCRGM
jgi:predicted Rossmann fold nucleotide-binding protein DprA/Smf involved in DNA uptake